MNNENKRSSIIITINNENYYNKPFEGWFPLPKKTKTHVTVSITSLMTSAKQLVFQDIQASRSLPKCWGGS